MAIAVEGLSKSFPAKGKRNPPLWAVRNLSFHCLRGEIVGLLGENGAGKTTTLRMLASLLSPSEGEAWIAGHEVSREPARVRRSIGMLFGGRYGLYDRLTARENIRYFAMLNGLSEETIDDRLRETARMLEMEDFLDRRAGTLSTGMSQKTSIARTIIHDPAVLLLDEPVAGLDVSSSANIFRFIRLYRSRGKTVLLSSHRMDVVRRLCDRVQVIHRGEMVAGGTPEELLRAAGAGQGESETGDLSSGERFERAFLELTGARG